jgi:hypothetical protein
VIDYLYLILVAVLDGDGWMGGLGGWMYGRVMDRENESVRLLFGFRVIISL